MIIIKFLVISGNVKQDGLCRSLIDEIVRGAVDGGAETELFEAIAIERCRVCGSGWGICHDEHRCEFENGAFGEAHEKVRNADLLCIVTPVYWGETSEGLKSLLDRLRRCEFGQGALSGKPVLLAAPPGGTGNGLLSCMEQMDRFCRHTGAVIFDYISINRWNNDYKRVAAYSAARAMAEGRKAGITI